MASKSNIEWTDASWNPVTGCSKVSAGCKNCYAETWANMHRGEFSKDKSREFTDVRCHPDKLPIPVHWRKPRMIFVDSMSDLFHETVADEFIDKVLAVCSLCWWHTFQILTKRASRMFAYFEADWKPRVEETAREMIRTDLFIQANCVDLHSSAWIDHLRYNEENVAHVEFEWSSKLPNVWLGVSCEDQKTAHERIPLLMETPAARHFVSCEPLLGPIDLLREIDFVQLRRHPQYSGETDLKNDWYQDLHWVIVGGESGPNARPMHPDWVRSIRDQCQAAGVRFFFKQWGEWSPHCYGNRVAVPAMKYSNGTPMFRIGKRIAGRLLDGREWDEYPKGK
jgi:protein gp37